MTTCPGTWRSQASAIRPGSNSSPAKAMRHSQFWSGARPCQRRRPSTIIVEGSTHHHRAAIDQDDLLLHGGLRPCADIGIYFVRQTPGSAESRAAIHKGRQFFGTDQRDRVVGTAVGGVCQSVLVRPRVEAGFKILDEIDKRSAHAEDAALFIQQTKAKIGSPPGRGEEQVTPPQAERHEAAAAQRDGSNTA